MSSSSKNYRTESKHHKRTRSEFESSDVYSRKNSKSSRDRPHHKRARKSEDSPRFRSISPYERSSKYHEERRHKRHDERHYVREQRERARKLREKENRKEEGHRLYREREYRESERRQVRSREMERERNCDRMPYREHERDYKRKEYRDHEQDRHNHNRDRDRQLDRYQSYTQKASSSPRREPKKRKARSPSPVVSHKEKAPAEKVRQTFKALVDHNKKKEERQNCYGYDVYESTEKAEPTKCNEEISKPKYFAIGHSLEEKEEKERKLLEIKTKLAEKRLETLKEPKIQLQSNTDSGAQIAKFKKPTHKDKQIRQKLKAEENLGKKLEERISKSEADSDLQIILSEMVSVGNVEEKKEINKVLSKAQKLKQKDSLIKMTLPMDIAQIKEEDEEESKEKNVLKNRLKEVNKALKAATELRRAFNNITAIEMAAKNEKDMEPENEIKKNLNKVEKDFQLMQTMSSTKTLTILQHKQKETKKPYVILSRDL